MKMPITARHPALALALLYAAAPLVHAQEEAGENLYLHWKGQA